MKILIVEDDAFRAKATRELISERWPEVGVENFRTELRFIKSFPKTADAGYDLIILDQMLPYTDVDDDETESAPEGYTPFSAGTRCYSMLKDDPRTKDIPVIFHTIMSMASVPADVIYVQKSGDHRLTDLLSEIDNVLTQSEKKPSEPS